MEAAQRYPIGETLGIRFGLSATKQYGYRGWETLLVESQNMFSSIAVPSVMGPSVIVSMSRTLEY